MIKNVLCIISFLLAGLICNAQTNDSLLGNSWNINMGYQNFRILDKNISPLIYVSNNGVIGFQFEKIKRQRVWNIGLSFSFGNNQPKHFGQREYLYYSGYSVDGSRDSVVYIINPTLSFLHTNIYYSYLWKISTKPIIMFLGATCTESYCYSGIGGNTWFFNQASLMPLFRTERSIIKNKYKINTELSIPICSWLLRQSYYIDPSISEESYFKAYLKKGSSVATINKFQQANFKCTIKYQLSNKHQMGLSYLFSWLNYSNIPNRNLRMYHNTVFINYTF